MEKETKTYQAQLAVDNGRMLICDVIEHQGQFWLVPEWLDSPDGKLTRPQRIIALASLPHAAMGGMIDFLVNDPVPNAVLFGQPSPEQARKFGVVNLPEIVRPRRGVSH